MAISHIVVLAAALLALLSLPCALVVVVHPDGFALNRGGFARRSGAHLRLLRRLDHDLSRPAPRICDPTPVTEERLPAIEQIAAELRRLDRQRHCGPTVESRLWLAAVVRAYDGWLRLACCRLDVAEHLEPLEGVDRDIERVRIEGELQAAGLMLRSTAHRPPQ